MPQEQATTTPEFSAMGQKTIDTMLGMQKGFLDALQELNQQWIYGMNAESALASEFFSKLTTAKSFPDAAVACQGCMNRQMEIMAENGRQLMAAGEKFMPQMFGNGGSAAGT